MATSSKKLNEIPVVSFDLGNRKNAITDGTKIRSYPSYSDYTGLTQDFQGYTTEDFKAYKSFHVQIGAQEFNVGDVAGYFAAQPTFAGDKWLKVKEFLFAALHSLEIGTTSVIKELRCTVPNDQDHYQRSPFEVLANKTHQFKVNGIEYTVHIEKVTILAEGVCAWMRAVNENLLQYPDYLNGVLDLGGGTAIARLVAPNGMIYRDYELVLSQGTCALASNIAKGLRKQSVEGLIMDAIADGSFMVNSTPFKNLYDMLLPRWVADIRAEINKAWRPIENQYAQILVVGGSTPIFAPYVQDKPNYVIAPNPQFYALEGMQNG